MREINYFCDESNSPGPYDSSSAQRDDRKKFKIRRITMKSIISALLCIFVGFSDAYRTNSTQLQSKIISGILTNMPPQEKTFLLSLTNKGEHFCSALKLNNLFALSTAHCTLQMVDSSLRSFDDFRVTNGGPDRSKHRTRKIKDVHVNRKYLKTLTTQGQLSPYNVGVIKVVIPFQNDVKSIDYDPEYIYSRVAQSKEPFVMGWGSLTCTPIGNTKKTYPDKLHFISVKVYGNVECGSLFGFKTIHKNLICITGSKNGGNAGEGDLGVPVMINGKGMAIVTKLYSYDASLPVICILLNEEIHQYIIEAQYILNLDRL